MNQKGLWNLNIRIFNFGGYVKRLQFFFLKHETYSAIKKNRELVRSENSKKKVYVCALGPSLKDVDLYKIDGDTIVVNRFYKFGKEHPTFVPTYYMITDYNFMRPENKIDLEGALSSYVDKGTIFILNSKLASSSVVNIIPRSQLYFISPFDGRMRPHKDYKIDGWMPAFQNVVGAAILSLMLMGYKDINLLGCDFNSFASTKQIHCYKDQSEKRLYTMYYELFAYSFAAKDHADLKEYAERKGYRITNMTKGSLIDAYPLEIDESLYKM